VQTPAYSPVEQIAPEYFVVQTNVPVEQDVLKHYLVQAFTDRMVQTDFEFGLSDCTSDTLEYRGYYQMAGGKARTAITAGSFPKLKRENYYFGVYFPNRRQFLLSHLSVWTISSFLLLCFIGFMGYLLVIVFRQRRLGEIQKDFVSNMTHEFRTPLSSIQLSAEVLSNPAIIGQPQRLFNYAAIISNQSARLTAQVERVLQMTDAEERGLQLNKTSFIWQDLLEEEVESIRRGQEGNVLIALHLPEAPVHFSGDIRHLKHAVSNLIDNAVKYSRDEPEVHITLTTTANAVRISIRDNGIGIKRQHQKMLFRKFYRVPTGNVHNVKGFGLGLNYTRLITRAHGGSIECESQIDKGSIFTLTFPHY
jgi:two-component system phosphate regulon sensor histidine kinase PhoR